MVEIKDDAETLSDEEAYAVVLLYGEDILESKGMIKQKEFVQHGDCSVFEHSVGVAKECVKRAYKSKESVDMRSLVRGALLHDYFLYDWHIPDKSRPMHGRYHPRAACKNAEEDFKLTDIERDIIKKHMFPLTLTPPKYRESVLVCLVDKVCSVYEIFNKNAYGGGTVNKVFERIRGTYK